MSASIDDRFVALIDRMCGVRLDPRTAQMSVGNGRITFFAPTDDAAPIIEAMVGVHGIDPSGIDLVWLDADAMEVSSHVGAVEALIGLSLDALDRRRAAAEVMP